MSTNRSLKIVEFFKPRQIKISSAYLQYVWDDAGRRYLDCHTGHGAAFLGHRNPIIVERIMEQMKTLTIAPPSFKTDIAEETLSKLSKILPSNIEQVYFLNSGSEAVELALKIARKVTGRKKFISFINAFHGRTMGALSVTWNPKYREGFDPFPWSVQFLPYNAVDEILKAVDENVAAIILEPIQGEGGLAQATEEFVKAARDACYKAGSLLIIDEIQTGFGRTGSIWAHERFGIKPDVLVTGKSIGGGFPVSMVAFDSSIAGMLKEGEHGSTHGGNPLALAAVSGGIDVLLKDEVHLRARASGEKLSNCLRYVVEECSHVARGLRGRGLMLGIDLRFNPDEIVKKLQDRGLLCLKAGLTVLRLLPPYMINEEDIKFCSETIKEVLRSYKAGGDKGEGGD